jgi:hypothetical protein
LLEPALAFVAVGITGSAGVEILRPDALEEVTRFIRINQPPVALGAHPA